MLEKLVHISFFFFNNLFKSIYFQFSTRLRIFRNIVSSFSNELALKSKITTIMEFMRYFLATQQFAILIFFSFFSFVLISI